MTEADAPKSDSAMSLTEQLAKLTTFAGVFAAYLFIAGSCSQQAFFREFGINARLLENPLQSILVLGFLSSNLSGALLLIPVSSVTLLVFGANRIPLIKKIKWEPFRFSPFYALLTVLLATLATIVISGWLGQQAARDRLAQDISVLSLNFKEGSSNSRDSKMLVANSEGKLRLLAQTKDLVIAYERVSGNEVTTYVIARSELGSIRLSPVLLK